MADGKRRGRDLLHALELAVGPVLISAALRVLSWCVRIRFLDLGNLFPQWDGGEQVILAFWHSRVVMMPLAYRGKKICIMNSQHRDGEIATRALERWGIRSVRGSATRGGIRGFLQLVDSFRQGFDLAVVPDGPRGPRCRAKPGAVYLAKATGAPLYPVSYAASRKAVLKSWDRLVIPLPFSRIVYVICEPMRVPRDASDEALEAMTAELEARLNRATEIAESAVAGGALAAAEGAPAES